MPDYCPNCGSVDLNPPYLGGSEAQCLECGEVQHYEETEDGN